MGDTVFYSIIELRNWLTEEIHDCERRTTYVGTQRAIAYKRARDRVDELLNQASAVRQMFRCFEEEAVPPLEE